MNPAFANLHDVYAVTHGSDQILRVVFPTEQQQIGHAGERGEAVILSPPVAGGCPSHAGGMPTIQKVLLYLSVVDEARSARRVPFVVEGCRPSASWKGGVVDDRDAFGRHGCSGLQTGAGRGNVRFQQVPGRLVKPHATPAPLEYDGIRTRRRLPLIG